LSSAFAVERYEIEQGADKGAGLKKSP
jgi:hypothetical protein